ncbi:MAG: AI-2E family transporter, partial [Microlunatus sp.]|nr:AI-2E family transporter [Microlunatus sp.]
MGLPSSGDPPGRRDHADRHPTRAALARRVRRWGRTSWALVGIALAIAIGYSAAAALSGLVVPSLFAVFAGVSLVPVLDWWVAKGLNRRLGALILILGLGSVVLLGGLVLLRGLVLEGDAIRITVVRAVGALHSWLDNGDPGRSSALVDAVASSAAPLLTGAAAWASAFFSVTLALAIGAFVAVFMLYYVLVDWAELREWVARHLGVPAELGSQIIEDPTDVVRR